MELWQLAAIEDVQEDESERQTRHRKRGSYLPEARIVLCGCRPLVPYRGYRDRSATDDYPPFHVPDHPGSIRKPDFFPNFPPGSRCPACHGAIGAGDKSDLLDPDWLDPDDLDRVTECELCGSMAEVNEETAWRLRLEVEVIERTRDHVRTAEDEARKILDQVLDVARERVRQDGGSLFTPQQIRRLWFGSKGSLIPDSIDLPNRAKFGRDFLFGLGYAVLHSGAVLRIVEGRALLEAA